MSMNDDEWQNLAEDGLKELIKGANVAQEKMDNSGEIHTLYSRVAPNIEAIKFALKNRSKGKWSDKTEVTHTQINVNLNASYNEVKDIMEKEKKQIQEKRAIDADYKTLE